MATTSSPGITTENYAIDDISDLLSPSLVLFREGIEHNLDQMIAVTGSVERLRPHCKTHKMAKVIELALARGITKHKCATIAEAEMLAAAGARDIFLAYNLVGPNIGRAIALLEQYDGLKLMATVDHERPLAELSRALVAAGRSMELLLDINTGMGRTGILPGPAALPLYQSLSHTPGVEPGGLHVYDGHNQQQVLAERKEAVMAVWDAANAFRQTLLQQGLPVPRVVAGGSGSFPIFAAINEPTLEVSPGTVIFYDAGYTHRFPELKFVPAAVLLTRVISKPGPNRITLDLGNKAVASDPPFGKRLFFPDLPTAREVIHSEEHLVLETDEPLDLTPGDALVAIPMHICPTSALHKEAYVVSHGKLVDRWEVTARNRCLTV
ncbi:D-TA family PLP-dependent enzyme [Lignipirellula cremea]|uniref:D-threonine aldolase n=1 Tax=Lignipirellula cremea TaxID=2528010 RepID=A0A518DZP2_9BACT|nr:D-TA family PLP-dependent enzyme [Lignipirellula cremea]QDU97285.1 D-threonine aldolase [Lignipirellula cremea]